MGKLSEMRKIELIQDIAPSLSAPKPLKPQKNFPDEWNRDVLGSYFDEQNHGYVKELDWFADWNGSIPACPKAMVFVPCYNENANLVRLVEHYSNQSIIKSDEASVVVVFVINAPIAQDSAQDSKNYQESVRLLMELSTTRRWLHLVAKRFPHRLACLGRARKYGLDYCMRLAERAGANNVPIISNEGDTVDLGHDFISNHIQALEEEGIRLVQGEIVYPQEVAEIPLLKLFLQTRESVHLGQGLAHEYLPSFGGIMPVGRNFSLPAWVGATVGGIDPTHRPGTDDDITLGMQISRAMGANSKVYRSIPLVTNPRREVKIVHGICRGEKIDARTSYESFHSDVSIYAVSTDITQERCHELAQIEVSESLRQRVVAQYYQWVHRSVVREYIADLRLFRESAQEYVNHAVGYWELEGRILQIYRSKILEYENSRRKRIIRRHMWKAQELFAEFCRTNACPNVSWHQKWVPDELNEFMT